MFSCTLIDGLVKFHVSTKKKIQTKPHHYHYFAEGTKTKYKKIWIWITVQWAYWMSCSFVPSSVVNLPIVWCLNDIKKKNICNDGFIEFHNQITKRRMNFSNELHQMELTKPTAKRNYYIKKKNTAFDHTIKEKNWHNSTLYLATGGKIFIVKLNVHVFNNNNNKTMTNVLFFFQLNWNLKLIITISNKGLSAAFFF